MAKKKKAPPVTLIVQGETCRAVAFKDIPSPMQFLRITRIPSTPNFKVLNSLRNVYLEDLHGIQMLSAHLYPEINNQIKDYNLSKNIPVFSVNCDEIVTLILGEDIYQLPVHKLTIISSPESSLDIEEIEDTGYFRVTATFNFLNSQPFHWLGIEH